MHLLFKSKTIDELKRAFMHPMVQSDTHRERERWAEGIKSECILDSECSGTTGLQRAQKSTLHLSLSPCTVYQLQLVSSSRHWCLHIEQPQAQHLPTSTHYYKSTSLPEAPPNSTHYYESTSPPEAPPTSTHYYESTSPPEAPPTSTHY